MGRWPESAEEVQVWLAKRLRKPVLPPVVWHELLRERHVQGAIDSATREAFKFLEDTARSLMRVASGRTVPRPRAKQAGAKVYLTREEILRAGAFSTFLGSLASRDGAVVRFRHEFLDGGILDRLEAKELLSSPTPYLLGGNDLRKASISLWDHKPEVTHQREALEGGRWRDHVVLRIPTADIEAFDFEVERSTHDGLWLDIPPNLWGLATPFAGVEPFVRPSSVFDQLRKASNWLSIRFPWERWQAVWFTLTGEAPFVPPIQPGTKGWTSGSDKKPRRGAKARNDERVAYRRNVLTLEVEPWLSTKSLVRIYRAYQREWLGLRNRKTEDKSLALFEFVTIREGNGGRRRKWEDLMKEWNRRHPPDWQYGEYRNFRRDYERVRQTILLPKAPVFGPIPLW